MYLLPSFQLSSLSSRMTIASRERVAHLLGGGSVGLFKLNQQTRIIGSRGLSNALATEVGISEMEITQPAQVVARPGAKKQRKEKWQSDVEVYEENLKNLKARSSIKVEMKTSNTTPLKSSTIALSPIPPSSEQKSILANSFKSSKAEPTNPAKAKPVVISKEKLISSKSLEIKHPVDSTVLVKNPSKSIIPKPNISKHPLSVESTISNPPEPVIPNPPKPEKITIKPPVHKSNKKSKMPKVKAGKEEAKIPGSISKPTSVEPALATEPPAVVKISKQKSKLSKVKAVKEEVKKPDPPKPITNSAKIKSVVDNPQPPSIKGSKQKSMPIQSPEVKSKEKQVVKTPSPPQPTTKPNNDKLTVAKHPAKITTSNLDSMPMSSANNEKEEVKISSPLPPITKPDNGNLGVAKYPAIKTHNAKAEMPIQAPEVKDAKKEVKISSSLPNSNAEIISNITFYLSRGELDKAVEAIETKAVNLPQKIILYGNLAVGCVGRGMYVELITLYESSKEKEVARSTDGVKSLVAAHLSLASPTSQIKALLTFAGLLGIKSLTGALEDAQIIHMLQRGDYTSALTLWVSEMKKRKGAVSDEATSLLFREAVIRNNSDRVLKIIENVVTKDVVTYPRTSLALLYYFLHAGDLHNSQKYSDFLSRQVIEGNDIFKHLAKSEMIAYHARHGEYEKAEKHLKEYVTNYPVHPRAYASLICSRIKFGFHPSSIQPYIDAMRQSNVALDTNTLISIMGAYNDIGDLRSAWRTYSSIQAAVTSAESRTWVRNEIPLHGVNIVLEMLGKEGKVASMENLYTEACKSSKVYDGSVDWFHKMMAAIINGYGWAGQANKALLLWNWMWQSGSEAIHSSSNHFSLMVEEEKILKKVDVSDGGHIAKNVRNNRMARLLQKGKASGSCEDSGNDNEEECKNVLTGQYHAMFPGSFQRNTISKFGVTEEMVSATLRALGCSNRLDGVEKVWNQLLFARFPVTVGNVSSYIEALIVNGKYDKAFHVVAHDLKKVFHLTPTFTLVRNLFHLSGPRGEMLRSHIYQAYPEFHLTDFSYRREEDEQKIEILDQCLNVERVRASQLERTVNLTTSASDLKIVFSSPNTHHHHHHRQQKGREGTVQKQLVLPSHRTGQEVETGLTPQQLAAILKGAESSTSVSLSSGLASESSSSSSSSPQSSDPSPPSLDSPSASDSLNTTSTLRRRDVEIHFKKEDAGKRRSHQEKLLLFNSQQ